MDVTSQGRGSDITQGGANKSLDQSECIVSQRMANGTLQQHTELPIKEAPPPGSDRTEDGDSSDDLVTDTSTNDVSRLLPNHTPSTNHLRKHKDLCDDCSSVDPNTNRVPPPPICSPPSPSIPPSTSTSITPPPSTSSPPLPHPLPLRSSHCNGHSLHHYHQSSSKKRLSSTAKSPSSLQTDAAHIKEVAGDDCCVHCILACLFCELLSMCSVLGECLACGGGGAGCCKAIGCCCGAEAAEGMACTEEACSAVLDCGILEDCCESSDCLEICLECCSICFPA